ncbi:MAG: RNA polymerase sigma factor SigJ [Gordonia sp. (in: high G+C Gram-positive bacteria)]|nr:MAG: RNA polymerase sigma factor SigJ [Gordonia sp. (in: high G+C Gram-positive bacteria)]
MPSLADRFQDQRARLLAVGYRITGSVTDAEDAVQESWLRLADVDVDSINDLGAWLTTVVGRICLDRLRSAAVRREQYVGQWLPEPVVTALPSGDSQDPLQEVLASEDSRYAAMVVLETLTPPMRVAFVMHDGFGVPFAEIGDLLGVNAASARQMASRARRIVAGVPAPVPEAEQAEAVQRLVAALASNDVDSVVAALDPDAMIVGDANRTTPTAVKPIHGANGVARFLLGLVRRYGESILSEQIPVLVNGELGAYSAGWDAAGDRRASPARASCFVVRDGRVAAIYDIADPAKLKAVPDVRSSDR